MFQDKTIREGDCLLVTSHLGHNKGKDEICSLFSIEFAMLGVDQDDGQAVRNMYRRAHPSLTVYRGLSDLNLTNEVKLNCLGCIKYQDAKRSPMGLYGYSISEGKTVLKTLIEDKGIQYFDMNEFSNCAAVDF